jgi:hypothetical protein
VREQGHTQFEILEVLESLELASEREIFWQEKLGYGRDNYVPYAIAYKTYSRPKAGIKKSEEAKRNISLGTKGIPKGPKTEEHKQKISVSKKGKPWTEARIQAQLKRKLI